MANRTVTALFDRYEDAADAVRRLEAAGVAHGDISIVSNDKSHAQYYGAVPGDASGMPDQRVTGTGTGASLGTVLGGGAGLLAGLGMLAIPGLGPVVAAGWLAATLVGAGVGAAAGGIVGSLTDIGVSEPDAHAYAEGIRRGGTLVTVKAADGMAERVSGILGQGGAVHMPERETAWRGEGWGGRYASAATGAGAGAGTATATGAPAYTEAGVVGSPAYTDPGAVGVPTYSAPAVTGSSALPDDSMRPSGRSGIDDLGRSDTRIAGERSTTRAAEPVAADARDRVRVYDQP